MLFPLSSLRLLSIMRFFLGSLSLPPLLMHETRRLFYELDAPATSRMSEFKWKVAGANRRDFTPLNNNDCPSSIRSGIHSSLRSTRVLILCKYLIWFRNQSSTSKLRRHEKPSGECGGDGNAAEPTTRIRCLCWRLGRARGAGAREAPSEEVHQRTTRCSINSWCAVRCDARLELQPKTISAKIVINVGAFLLPSDPALVPAIRILLLALLSLLIPATSLHLSCTRAAIRRYSDVKYYAWAGEQCKKALETSAEKWFRLSAMTDELTRAGRMWEEVSGEEIELCGE